MKGDFVDLGRLSFFVLFKCDAGKRSAVCTDQFSFLDVQILKYCAQYERKPCNSEQTGISRTTYSPCIQYSHLCKFTGSSGNVSCGVIFSSTAV